MSKRPEAVVTAALTLGVALSYVTGNHWFIIALAVIVPFYLAYVRRETNLFEKSKFYDRDFLIMVAVVASAILVFRLFFDPRIGLILMILTIPFAAILFESLRRRKVRTLQRQ